MVQHSDPDPVSARPKALLFRLDTPQHRCPWGLRSRDLLRRQGFEVEDHLLRSDAEAEEFKRREGVETTPQTYISGERIGGYEDLRRHFRLKVRDPDAPTYAPVIALFATAALLAGAMAIARGPVDGALLLRWFGAISMVLFALQKLRDLDGFVTRLLGYDLIARRWVRWGWIYAFAELFAGLAMLAGVWMPLAGAVALVIGLTGAVSVIQAVWIERRTLKCACVGSTGNVPLGPVSLAENLGMVAMGLWMLV